MKKSNHAPATSSPTISGETAWPACVITAICCAIFLWVLLGLDSETIRIPFSYSDDALVHYSIAKNIAAGNWWWNNPRLGMPFGADWRDFPMHLCVDYAGIRVLTWIFRDPFLSLNLWWLLAIVATSVFATFAFVQLGINRAVSIALGLVYAMQPYTWLRNIFHFNLIFYLVPLLGAYLVKTAVDEIQSTEVSVKPWWRRVPIWVYFAAAAQGLSYAYNAFFACFFLALAALIVFAVRKSIRAAAPFGVVIAVIVLFSAINLSPSLRYWAQQGPNRDLVQKSVAESDVYGMKLRYLLLPTVDHKIPWFRRAAERFERKFPAANESGTARLGLLGALGFLYLLSISLYGLFQNPSPRDIVFRVMACLTVGGFLLSTVGGFGSIFNTLVSPDVRAYNRTVTYISFFSVATVAILLTRLKQRLGDQGIKVAFLNGGLALLAVLAVFDESAVTFLRMHKDRAIPFYADRDFGRKLESAFPGQERIFQLPHTGFPIDDAPTGRMYADSLPYLHTSRLRFSWGAVEGRHFQWGTAVATLPADLMVADLTKAGFAGLWVSADAYADPAKILVPLTDLLGPPILVNSYRHQYVFDLRPVKAGSEK